MSVVTDAVDAPFALCLTHDVDRPYKTYQAPFYALAERDPTHLRSLLPGENPYWQFEEIMALEDDLGVRSAFYFLDAPRLSEYPLAERLSPRRILEHLGRYDVDRPPVADVVRSLDEGGWEVGLHGSFDSYRDPDRLAAEKATLERTLGHPVRGTRQHFLNLRTPDTWRYHRRLGLAYDASPGSSTEYGFQHGYDPYRPFGDRFVVFPLTAMEVAVMESAGGLEPAWRECERLLAEAREHGAAMSVLWHPRYFNEREFPGYRELYRRLVERALEMDAWVGPPGDLYERLDHPADERPIASIGR